MEFLAFNFSIFSHLGKNNANAEFLSRLPLLPTDESISRYCTLPDLDDLGVYIIHARGLIAFSCPIPDIGLGGLVPLSLTTSGSGLVGLISQPDPSILGGMPVIHNDFPDLAYAENPCSSYSIRVHENYTRSAHTRLTRSQTTILSRDA